MAMSSLLHDLDFYAWTQQQVDLLKSGNLADVDFKNLILEIESMGASHVGWAGFFAHLFKRLQYIAWARTACAHPYILIPKPKQLRVPD